MWLLSRFRLYMKFNSFWKFSKIQVLIWDVEAQPNRHAVFGATNSRPDLVNFCCHDSFLEHSFSNFLGKSFKKFWKFVYTNEVKQLNLHLEDKFSIDGYMICQKSRFT